MEEIKIDGRVVSSVELDDFNKGFAILYSQVFPLTSVSLDGIHSGLYIYEEDFGRLDPNYWWEKWA